MFAKLDTSEAEGRIAQDKADIAKHNRELEELTTKPRVFASGRICHESGLALEAPSVHFFCGHSFNYYYVLNSTNNLGALGGGTEMLNSGNLMCPKCSLTLRKPDMGQVTSTFRRHPRRPQ